MSKREKIIVSVMAATLLLGGYLYVMPGTTGSRPGINLPGAVPALDFAQQIVRKLDADTSLANELFTIRSAERKWGRDPFLTTDASLSDTPSRKAPGNPPEATATQLNLDYTGFLEVGTRRLAIINGIDYALGDAIDSQGNYVRRIQSHQVEIGKRNAPDVNIFKLTLNESITGR